MLTTGMPARSATSCDLPWLELVAPVSCRSLYTAVGRQKVVPEHVAVPAMSTLGYVSILVGPAFIGFLAQVSSLPIALMAVAILLLGVAASGRMIQA
jgi:hypothetical protein